MLLPNNIFSFQADVAFLFGETLQKSEFVGRFSHVTFAIKGGRPRTLETFGEVLQRKLKAKQFSTHVLTEMAGANTGAAGGGSESRRK